MRFPLNTILPHAGLALFVGLAPLSVSQAQSNQAPTEPGIYAVKPVSPGAGPEGGKQKRVSGNCQPDPGGAKQVVRIIDTETLRLGDGTLLKVSGLETADPIGMPGNTLIYYLKKLTLGKAVRSKRIHKNPDRYGRQRAQLFMGDKGGLSWVQAEIVKRGLAMVAPDVGASQCTRELLGLEHQARQNKQGLWGAGIFQIRSASRSKELLKYAQTFQIIEGRIKRLSTSRGKIYINFGRNWKNDLTISLTKSAAQAMKLDPEKLGELKGKFIRARGWVEINKGPLIRVSNSHQLEMMDRPR